MITIIFMIGLFILLMSILAKLLRCKHLKLETTLGVELGIVLVAVSIALDKPDNFGLISHDLQDKELVEELTLKLTEDTIDKSSAYKETTSLNIMYKGVQLEIPVKYIKVINPESDNLNVKIYSPTKEVPWTKYIPQVEYYYIEIQQT